MDYQNTEEFLFTAPEIPIVDVRSPAEFEAGHITGALSIPLFKDEERAIVGTIYKKQGKKEAIDRGLEIAGPKMAALSKKAEDVAVKGALNVYCWRGGMRSNRMAWLFEQAGLQCKVLEGGYKAYRNTALARFTELPNLLVIDGPTGSGKTDILHALEAEGEQILDLEEFASHKGSAFGSIGMKPQPSSQQFQNNLFQHLRLLDENKRLWIEREGMTIGQVYLPQTLWVSMRSAQAIAIKVPSEIRVKRLVDDYGNAPRPALEESIRKLQQYLGGQHMNTALELLSEERLDQVAELLLRYYDKRYSYSKAKYLSRKPLTIELNTADDAINAQSLIKLANQEKL